MKIPVLRTGEKNSKRKYKNTESTHQALPTKSEKLHFHILPTKKYKNRVARLAKPRNLASRLANFQTPKHYSDYNKLLSIVRGSSDLPCLALNRQQMRVLQDVSTTRGEFPPLEPAGGKYWGRGGFAELEGDRYRTGVIKTVGRAISLRSRRNSRRGEPSAPGIRTCAVHQEAGEASGGTFEFYGNGGVLGDLHIASVLYLWVERSPSDGIVVMEIFANIFDVGINKIKSAALPDWTISNWETKFDMCIYVQNKFIFCRSNNVYVHFF